jgi:hypothetical protein
MDIEEIMQCLLAKMELQQIMELLLAIQEEIIASQHEMMMARMEANMDSMKAELISTIKNFKFNGKETMVCQETMEARLEVEPASVDTTPEVVHDQEVPRENAEVMPVGEPRKRCRNRRHLAAVRRQKKTDQNLDTGRRRKGQKRAQRKDGCLKNLAAARRGTTRRAAVARRRRNFCTQERNTIKCGPLKQLVAARKGTTRCAAVARCREISLRKVGPETTLQEEFLENGRPAIYVRWTRRAEWE